MGDESRYGSTSPRRRDPPEFLLFTDADIGYAPDTLVTLVRRAERDRLVLASLMARLRCTSFAERAFIPAFIFFSGCCIRLRG